MGPRGPAIESLVLRTLAVLAWLLAAAVLARWVALVLGEGVQEGLPAEAGARESAFRSVARLAWGLALAYTGWRAWRRPAGLPDRLRRRLLRVVAVLAHESVQREYVESTPLVSLREALSADWDAAYRPGQAPFLRAFDGAELAELAAFDTDVRRLLAALPGSQGAATDVARLDAPAWRALRERAGATFRRLGGALAKTDPGT